MRFLATLMLCCAVAVPSTTTDPFVGQWELNPSKCKYGGGRVPKQLTVVYEPNGAGIRYQSYGIDGDGNQLSCSYTASFDGKLYPVVGTKAWAPVILKRADARKIEAKFMRYGQVKGTAVSVVSKDGRTLTVTTVAWDAAGKGFTNVSVFDRK